MIAARRAAPRYGIDAPMVPLTIAAGGVAAVVAGAIPRRSGLGRALRWWLRIQGVAALAQAAVFLQRKPPGSRRGFRCTPRT